MGKFCYPLQFFGLDTKFPHETAGFFVPTLKRPVPRYTGISVNVTIHRSGSEPGNLYDQYVAEAGQPVCICDSGGSKPGSQGQVSLYGEVTFLSFKAVEHLSAQLPVLCRSSLQPHWF